MAECIGINWHKPINVSDMPPKPLSNGSRDGCTKSSGALNLPKWGEGARPQHRGIPGRRRSLRGWSKKEL